MRFLPNLRWSRRPPGRGCGCQPRRSDHPPSSHIDQTRSCLESTLHAQESVCVRLCQELEIGSTPSINSTSTSPYFWTHGRLPTKGCRHRKGYNTDGITTQLGYVGDYTHMLHRARFEVERKTINKIAAGYQFWCGKVTTWHRPNGAKT